MTRFLSMLKRILGKFQTVIGICIIAILLASSLFYRIQYVTTQNKLDEYQKTYVIHKSNIGEILDTKAFSFAVTKVEYDETGIRELPVAPGMKFVMVSVSLYNKTSSSVHFLPIIETYMRDSVGNRYEITTAPKIEVASIAGTIERAKGYEGILGFMVQKQASGLEFVYEPKSFPDANTIIYGIN